MFVLSGDPRDIFHILVARYNLFVLKIVLNNNNQPTNLLITSSWSCGCH